MRLRIISLLIVFSCLLTAGAAFSACTVSITSTTPVNFVYDPLLTTVSDAAGNIAVTVAGCIPGPPGPGERVDITVAIGPSPTPPGGFDPTRWLQHPVFGDLLRYNVFRNEQRTQIWGGQGGAGTGETVNNLSNVTLNFPVYGRIPALQNVTSGTYTESLVVTVYRKNTQTVLATSSLTITANVIASCSVTGTTAVAFGVYDPLNAVDNIAGAGNFTFRCGINTPYTLHIAGVRQMNDGLGNLLDYELYTNGARTTLWPSSFASSTETGVAAVAPITRDIFGRIPAGQDVPVGALYSSVVTVTVTY